METHPWSDNRKSDVLVDDANKDQVRFVGKWTYDKSRRCYAFSRRFDDTLGKEARSAYFYPYLKEADEYDVYYYYPRQKHPSSVINFNIFDGEQTHEVALRTKGLKILGQTDGEWVRIGTFKFAAGKAPYVEITNQVQMEQS